LPHSDFAYRAFYVIAVTEMVINIGVASRWKVATFKGTHLIERMSLLTLYICKALIIPFTLVILLTFSIVGEGVIDVLKSVAKVNRL
jgi:hypothetical protein